MIEISNVSKAFGSVKALDNVSFSVGNGEIVGYVGPNGAGKTTTIKICVGVLNSDTGDVKINGYSVSREKKIASKYVGWVPELPIFEPDEKALNYFIYLAGYYGISSSEARMLGKRMLEELGLGNALNMKLKNFSLGMKKRFALAISMINNPDNFIFDEVLNGLDPIGIAFFRDLTKRFKKENKAVLFSSHILKEVEDIADKVVFINKGRIIKTMNMEEIRMSTNPVIVIKLKSVDNKAIEIAKTISNNVNIENNIIRIYNPKIDTSEILNIFIKNNYKVEEIKKEEPSLEEIFFKIIGEHK